MNKIKFFLIITGLIFTINEITAEQYIDKILESKLEHYTLMYSTTKSQEKIKNELLIKYSKKIQQLKIEQIKLENELKVAQSNNDKAKIKLLKKQLKTTKNRISSQRTICAREFYKTYPAQMLDIN